ncbi:twin-arginine translocation signal domain-containing protein [Halorussus halophilus]|nr:twin-arginine translocation signal domain-containing protein [Halorussus halophilus]
MTKEHNRRNFLKAIGATAATLKRRRDDAEDVRSGRLHVSAECLLYVL